MLRMEIPERKNFEQHLYVYIYTVIYIYIYIFPHDIVCVYIHIDINAPINDISTCISYIPVSRTYQKPQIYKPQVIARVSGVSILL